MYICFISQHSKRKCSAKFNDVMMSELLKREILPLFSWAYMNCLYFNLPCHFSERSKVLKMDNKYAIKVQIVHRLRTEAKTVVFFL